LLFPSNKLNLNGKAVHAVALFMKNTNLGIVILGVYTLTVVVVTAPPATAAVGKSSWPSTK
jgi:hypothetical protein